MKRFVNGIILPVILLLLWYIVTQMQVFSPYLLPSPTTVWEALMELAASGELAKHLTISLRRVFSGFFLAAATAIPLGILCGRSKYFYTYCWFLLIFSALLILFYLRNFSCFARSLSALENAHPQ